MITWRLKTKEGKVIEGDDSPFKIVKVEDIVEFLYIPKNIGVVLKEGQRLIYFKRHQRDVTFGMNNNHEELAHRITYFIGFQETKFGTNFKCITEVQPDGYLILRDSDGRAD